MQQQIIEPVEETYTNWFNPLERDQVVDVRQGAVNGPVTRYRIPAGQTVPIPSRYDQIVQRVHNNVIIGGQAPQLVRHVRDGDEPPFLDDALNTELAKKKRAAAEQANAEADRKIAEERAALASVEASAADKKLKAQQQRLPPDVQKG